MCQYLYSGSQIAIHCCYISTKCGASDVFQKWQHVDVLWNWRTSVTLTENYDVKHLHCEIRLYFTYLKHYII